MPQPNNEEKRKYHRKWPNQFFQLRCQFYCLILGHKYTEHFTGRRGIGEHSMAREVDYYYCTRCHLCDPERCEYPEEERKKLSYLFGEN